ncbi:telomerase RNA component interacting RNase isoform X1 [Lampetra fluviatilis]
MAGESSRSSRGSASSSSSAGSVNAFANDGSFLEMFKKKMEEQEARRLAGDAAVQRDDCVGGDDDDDAASSTRPPPPAPAPCLAPAPAEGEGVPVKLNSEPGPAEEKKRQMFGLIGRRRGGKVLKTGMVAKKHKIDEEEEAAQKGDTWAKYMAEVKKYKAHQCGDDDKNRPLVK